MAITGTVIAGREAVVPLTVVGFRGRSTEIEAVIDTGFTGHLTLPPGLAHNLGLPLLGSRYVTLANGATTSLDVYRATVLWEGGGERLVRAFAADGAPLVGTALLHGSLAGDRLRGRRQRRHRTVALNDKRLLQRPSLAQPLELAAVFVESCA